MTESPTSLNTLTDDQLLEAFRNTGNNVYLGVLLERYTLLLFGVCMKYLKNQDDAKDAVQQIFIKVLTELKKYKVEYFKSWLYMVARNFCLMQLRKKKDTISTSSQDQEFPFLETSSIFTNAEAIEREQLMEFLEQGLQVLPEAQQRCISLFYLSKFSYQQISAATGFSLLQVKSYIQNGKRNLKLWIEKKLKNHVS